MVRKAVELAAVGVESDSGSGSGSSSSSRELARAGRAEHRRVLDRAAAIGTAAHDRVNNMVRRSIGLPPEPEAPIPADDAEAAQQVAVAVANFERSGTATATAADCPALHCHCRCDWGVTANTHARHQKTIGAPALWPWCALQLAGGSDGSVCFRRPGRLG